MNDISELNEDDDVILRTNDVDVIKDKQIGYDQWNPNMAECIIKPSRVIAVNGKCVEVRSASGKHYRFNSALLKPYFDIIRNMSFEEMNCAIKFGHLTKVKELLEFVGPNKKIKGYTLLMMATIEGHLDIVKLVIEKGAKVDVTNADGHTALHICLFHENIEICKALLERGADPNKKNKKNITPLMVAAHLGLPNFIMVLAGKSRTDLNIKNSDKNTALHIAVYKSQVQSVEALLTVGADVKVTNDKNSIPFHLAAAMGNKRILELFLMKKAGSLLDHQNVDGDTAIHIVVLNNHVECLKLLIKYKADKNIRNKKYQSPLDIAVHRINPDCVAELIDNGADPNSRDDERSTALHQAICIFMYSKMKFGGHLLEICEPLLSEESLKKLNDIIILLVKGGARLDTRNNKGVTPLDLCLDANFRTKLMKMSMEQEIESRKDEEQSVDDLKAIIAAMMNQDKCLKCKQRNKIVSFQCGHMACKECAKQIITCHVCSIPVKKKIEVIY